MWPRMADHPPARRHRTKAGTARSATGDDEEACHPRHGLEDGEGQVGHVVTPLLVG